MLRDAYYVSCDRCGTTTKPDISLTVLNISIRQQGWEIVEERARNGELCKIGHHCPGCRGEQP